MMLKIFRLAGIALLTALFVALALVARASYTQQYALAQDATFQGQVLVAELQTSIAVLAESTSVVGHATRASFAAKVIQDPTRWQPIVAYVIASQNNNVMTPLTVPSTVLDSLVQTAMNAQWTNMSGSFAQQP